MSTTVAALFATLITTGMTSAVSHDFTIFAWYRIAFGIVVLVTWQMGIVDWSSP